MSFHVVCGWWAVLTLLGVVKTGGMGEFLGCI